LPPEQPTEPASATTEAPLAEPAVEKPAPEQPEIEVDTPPPQGDTTAALQRQIEALRKSEELQRQRAVQAEQQGLSLAEMVRRQAAGGMATARGLIGP
jgi:hypothetical protein